MSIAALVAAFAVALSGPTAEPSRNLEYKSVLPGTLRASCDSWNCAARRHWRRKYNNLSPADRRWLASLRECESGNGDDEHNIPYHGRYQFEWNGRFRYQGRWVVAQSTAKSAGFTRDPHRIFNNEEDVRTVRWRNRAGAGQWPVCG